MPGEDALGPLQDLPGKWESTGHGWNMIALPFARTQPDALDYRLLLNQYDETLNFTLVDTKVPNRGVDNTHNYQTDQLVVTLDYEQVIHQVAVTDRPPSDVAGAPGLAIHHEPGLFLNMVNLTTDGINVARLASIPHGNSALALGTNSEVNGVAQIPPVNGLPVGVTQDLADPYLEPYQHFHANPFLGTVNDDPTFPGFDPTAPHLLLTLANQGVNVQTTTVLELDTTTESGGISNIPFIKKQADAAAMKSTFWIQKLDGDSPTFRLQYLQVVNLEFFPRADGLPGRIIWPHVSINTLDKVSDTPDMA
ncbi:MAG: heme-binding protein [Pseudonocardiaceae bacterium]